MNGPDDLPTCAVKLPHLFPRIGSRDIFLRPICARINCCRGEQIDEPGGRRRGIRAIAQSQAAAGASSGKSLSAADQLRGRESGHAQGFLPQAEKELQVLLNQMKLTLPDQPPYGGLPQPSRPGSSRGRINRSNELWQPTIRRIGHTWSWICEPNRTTG